MPDITNPQYIVFANTRCRPLADVAEQLYQTCKRFEQEYVAYGAASVPNTADNIADGSDLDGRKRMTGAQLQALKQLSAAMITWYETGSPTRIVQLQQFSVNGSSRF
jgi:hypothetical protein